jgi:ubiquinone biosynthesis protein
LYGKKISQIFDEFDPVPIASGSISQVYRAKYKGQKVVVKVRHPGVENNIEKDINILFFISKLLEKFSPSFSIPITSDSMKKTLLDQINFNNEK